MKKTTIDGIEYEIKSNEDKSLTLVPIPKIKLMPLDEDYHNVAAKVIEKTGSIIVPVNHMPYAFMVVRSGGNLAGKGFYVGMYNNDIKWHVVTDNYNHRVLAPSNLVPL